MSGDTVPMETDATVKTEDVKPPPPSNAPLLLTKPGQKFQTPTPGDADRVFYESLHKQKPESPMAQNYVIEYGILPMAEASELYKIYLERKRNPQAPVRAAPKPKKVKTQIIDGMGGDTGFSGGAGMEGVGLGAL